MIVVGKVNAFICRDAMHRVPTNKRVPKFRGVMHCIHHCDANAVYVGTQMR